MVIMVLGLRHHSSRWRGEKDQSHRREVLRTQYSIQVSLTSKKPFQRFLEILLIWVSRRTTCSTRTLTGRPGTSLLHGLQSTEGLSHLIYLKGKILSAYSRALSFFQLFPNMSSPNQFILDSIRSLCAIQVFSFNVHLQIFTVTRLQLAFRKFKKLVSKAYDF